MTLAIAGGCRHNTHVLEMNRQFQTHQWHVGIKSLLTTFGSLDPWMRWYALHWACLLATCHVS